MIRRLLLALCLLPTLAWAGNAYQTWFSTNFCNGSTLYWPMDESSGSLVNQCVSGSSYNLTTSGSPTYAQAGPSLTAASGVLSGPRGTGVLMASASSQYAEVNKDDTGSGPADLNHSLSMGCWEKQTSDATGVLLSSGHDATNTAGASNWSLLIAASGSGGVQFRIYQTGGDTSYEIVTGPTTAATGWHFMVGTWNQSTKAMKVYLDGSQDNSTTTTSGTISAATQRYIDIGRRYTAGGGNFLNGTTQDCFITNGEFSAANILAMYQHGVSSPSGSSWPHTVKRPELPRFRDDGYFEYAVSHGYNTGLISSGELVPQLLNIGYPNFALMPWGNAGTN